MSLRIMSNIDAMDAYRNLSITQNKMSSALEKLSSGYRINRAADDAAGLAISEGLRSQIGGLKVAVRNAQDGVSVVQTAEGALTEVHSILQRVRDLTVQAANEGSNNSDSENAIVSEINELGQALTDIASRTEFNGTKLLDGSTASLSFQVGANAGDTVSVNMANISGVATAVTQVGTDITTGLGTDVATAAAAASTDISSIDTQISTVSTARAGLGASQNRFEHTINSLNVAVENLSASESRIRDTDMAQQMMNFTKAQILSQAGTAMLAQANHNPQSVLKLLQ